MRTIATIRTAIQIQDGMSPAFRSMNNALNIVISSFESLQTASHNAVDTASIQAARQELARAETAFNDMGQGIRQADQQQQDFNESIIEGQSAADGLMSKIGGIVAAYLTLQTGASIISLSDQMTNTTARLNLMNDKLQTTAELQEMIFQSAKRTYTPYQQTADMVGKLGMQAMDAFGSTQEIVAFAEQINKTFTIAGTSAEGVSSTMLQLTQSMASGVMQGEELNAILDSAQPIVANIQKYLEEAMGIDASNIKELASEGVITAEIIKNAMFYAADETNKAFESMPLTFARIWTNFKSDAFDAFLPVLQKINDIANNDKFQSMVNGISSSLYTLSNIAMFVLSLLMSAGNFMYDNWSLIGPVVWGLTAAIGAYTIALMVNKAAQIAGVIWTGLKILATGLLTASTWAGVQATMAATAAQWGLNAAILSSPIFWIVIVIIAIIAVIYLAVAALNHFAGTSISATGIVAGVFSALGAFIFNIIAYMWNLFASIAEFFVNVWTHPIYSVKKLFANLTTNVLDMAISMTKGWDGFATSFVNAIIKAVNGAINAWNKFIDVLPDSVTGALGIGKGTEFSYRTSITSDLGNLKSGINDWVGEAPAGYWTAPKMDMKSVGGAWDAGYKWGSNFENSFGNDEKDKDYKDIFNNVFDPNALGALDDLGGSGADTAANTAKMADSMEGSEEDLKYLRDLAEQEVINRFTTAEISIDMSGMSNSINSDMDLDGVVSYLEEKVYETMTTAAEGGHE